MPVSLLPVVLEAVQREAGGYQMAPRVRLNPAE